MQRGTFLRRQSPYRQKRVYIIAFDENFNEYIYTLYLIALGNSSYVHDTRIKKFKHLQKQLLETQPA